MGHRIDQEQVDLTIKAATEYDIETGGTYLVRSTFQG